VSRLDQLMEIIHDAETASKPNVIVTTQDLRMLLTEIEMLRDTVTVAGVQLEKANSAFTEPTDLVEAEVRYATLACRRALSGTPKVPVRR